ncbi:MAG: tRNA (adenosine(37)-N6)-threonylcarbamoyltransferase complex ATPase subunit type 1 TsaE [Candidatus Zixiibacteriota bacterium]
MIGEKIITSSQKQTKGLGNKLALKLRRGSFVALSGSLGSGKTTLIKGICKGLGIRELVRSPCFVIMTQYPGKFPVYHFDLYRLKNPEELFTIGYDEYFYGDGICLVEWAEKAKYLLPERRIDVFLRILSEAEREIEIKEVKPKTQKHKKR